MRSLVPVCALLVLGCSARSPAPPSGTADAAVALDGPVLCIPGAQFACACAASAAGVQVCGPDGRALGPCSCPTTDAGAQPFDAPDVPPRPDVVDVPAADTGCAVGDEQPCVCPSWFGTQQCTSTGWGACVCPMDAATPDVVDAAQAPDAPDVVEAGPADAGPTVYALDPPPAVTEVRVLYARTCASTDGGACDSTLTDVAMGATCSRTGSRLAFNLRACTRDGTCASVTGAVPDYRSAAGAVVSVFGGEATHGRDFVVDAGSVAGGRQSFRVSFSAPATRNAAGVTGVPGRTLDTSRGDVWLLGCEVR